jgi:hypothetical protein
MKHAKTGIALSSIDQGWDEETCDEQETSGVFTMLRQPVADIAVGEMYGVAGPDAEPAPVYAAPYVLAGKDRVRFARDFYLGTRFVTGILPAEGWEDEMRAEGIPERMIGKCRAHLAEHAI